MVRHRCINCDTIFEHHGDKLRCPSCLRVNGIEPVLAEDQGNSPGGEDRAATVERARGSSRRIVIVVLTIIFGGAVIVGAGLLLHRKRTDVPRPGQLAVLDADVRQQTLRQRGVPQALLVDPFRTGPPVIALARPGSGKGLDRATAVARALGQRLAGIRVRLTELGKQEVREALELARALEAKKLERATSFELAALGVAVLRAAGLSAVLCELFELEGTPVRSAGVTGGIGRYAVAVYREGAIGGKPLAVFDPARAGGMPAWSGGGGDATMGSRAATVVPLDDGSAAAHLMALRAVALIRRAPRESSADAYELSRLALKVASPSPTLHVARAMVLLGVGGDRDAAAEAEKGVRLRGDPPRRTAWARMLLAQGQLQQAERELHLAVKKDAAFWPALTTLAQLSWLAPGGDRSKGDAQLQAALEVAAEEPAVQLLQARQAMAAGKAEEAIAVLERAVRGEPDSEAVLFDLYLALRRAGHGERADKVRQRLLAAAADRERVEQAIAALDQAEQRSREAGPTDDSVGDAPPPLPKKLPRLKLPDVSLGGP